MTSTIFSSKYSKRITSFRQHSNTEKGGRQERSEIISNKEKTICKTLAEAFEALSDNKKEYLLGFAEGVIAARSPDDDQGKDKEADKEIA